MSKKQVSTSGLEVPTIAAETPMEPVSSIHEFLTRTQSSKTELVALLLKERLIT